MLEVLLQQLGKFALFFCIGLLGYRFKLFHSGNIDALSKYVMRIALPALVLSNLVGNTTREDLTNSFSVVLIAFAVILLLYAFGILVSKVLRLKGERARVYQGVFTFNNIGFMGAPLIAEVFPGVGLLCHSLFTLADQVLLWTLGVYLTTPKEQFHGVKPSAILKKLVNPAMIALVIGVILVVSGVKLPLVLDDTVSSIGKSSSPVSLIYLGALLGGLNWKESFSRLEYYLIVPLKMIGFALALYYLLKFIGLDASLIGPLVTLVALPSMTSIAMFAKENGSDGEYALGAILVTSILSLVSLPIVFALMR